MRQAKAATHLSTGLPPLVPGCVWCADCAHAYTAYGRMPGTELRGRLLRCTVDSWWSHLRLGHPERPPSG